MKKQRNKNPIVPLSLTFGLLLSGCGGTAAVSEPPQATAKPVPVETPSEEYAEPEATPEPPLETVDQAPAETLSAEYADFTASEIQVQVLRDGSTLDMYKETYPDAETFIAAWGFVVDEPSYTYEDGEGNVQLALYYDETMGAGCGVRYVRWENGGVEPCGFAFETIDPVAEKKPSNFSAAQWDRWEGDYTATPEQQLGGIEDYQESCVYDAAGRVTSFESSGLIEGMEERLVLCSVKYTYDTTGTLRQRHLGRNPRWSATHDSSWNSYFDAQGRICHERGYITHGSQEYYYIYTDEDTVPAYCLYLDKNLGDWCPQFVRY